MVCWIGGAGRIDRPPHLASRPRHHPIIDELNLTLGPEEAKAHLEEGLSQRRVYAEKNWDGTGNYMGLHLPPEKVAAAQRRINHLAKQLKTETEARTMDQLRADIY